MAGETQRRLAAIVAADVAGYSRLMGADEEGTLEALKGHRRELVDPRITEHNGRIVKTTGDGILLEFASVLDAVRCCLDVQRAMADRNAEVPDDRRMLFRVGINLGDIIIDGDDIHGDGVNVAARLEALCEPGGIAVSGNVHEQVRDRLDCHFVDGGAHEVKNIARPVQVWRWAPETTAAAGPARTAEPALALPDKPSIAVLPFDNMSGDPEQEYFADGMAEDVITALSRFRSLFVIARNSTFTYKSRAVDIAQVGRELGVRYVVEGSVRKAGDQVRITAQLIDGVSGNHLWADRFDGNLEDIFDLQDQITEKIIVAVVPEVEAHERERVRRKPPESLDAWENYQRGLLHMYRANREDVDAAIGLLREATRRDPNFSAAWGMLGYAMWMYWMLGFAEGAEGHLAATREVAEQAVTLDANEAMAHVVLGRVDVLLGRMERALEEMQASIDINPNFAFGHASKGWARFYGLADLETALEYFETALRLSPRDPLRFVILMVKGVVLRNLGRIDDAVTAGLQSCRLQSVGYLPHMHLAVTLARAGRNEEAREALGKARRIEPTLSLALVRGTRVGMHKTMFEETLEGLAKAGLPETADGPLA